MPINHGSLIKIIMMRPGHLPVWPLLAVIILMAGCGGVGQKSPPDEVRAFFAAANEANYLGVMCLSPNQVDLSGYTHLIGVQYPPTQKVDVLSSPPSRRYQAFAVLESSIPYAAETYDPGLLEALKNKARAIGADAIIQHPCRQFQKDRQGGGRVQRFPFPYQERNFSPA